MPSLQGYSHVVKERFHFSQSQLFGTTVLCRSNIRVYSNRCLSECHCRMESKYPPYSYIPPETHGPFIQPANTYSLPCISQDSPDISHLHRYHILTLMCVVILTSALNIAAAAPAPKSQPRRGIKSLSRLSQRRARGRQSAYIDSMEYSSSLAESGNHMPGRIWCVRAPSRGEATPSQMCCVRGLAIREDTLYSSTEHAEYLVT